MFQPVKHAQAVLFKKGGRFLQVDLATWGGALFAKIGTGYVRLKADGSTGDPNYKLEALDLDPALLSSNRMGHLGYDVGKEKGWTLLDQEKGEQLLVGSG